MAPLPVSVIVVSRHRAAALVRCLVALTQQDHPAFEIIVVADPAGVGAAQSMGLAIKTALFDQANISAARNAGLALAAAPVVAFIDDDAVAEPTWLSRLTAPFGDPDIVASTGFIRGRNGISFQWQACVVDAQGQDHQLEISQTSRRQGTAQLAVKTQGTNCAFRRDTLLVIGGFDPAYRFYLDEADVNLRLADRGPTMIVPDAQVHHSYAASDRRRADRVPLSLHDIAASTAIFLRRHAPETDFLSAFTILHHREAARAKHHLVAGRIGTTEVAALMTSLTAGWTEGIAQPLSTLPILRPTTATFTPVSATGPKSGKVIAGRSWRINRLVRQATAALAAGQIVTVISLSPGMRAHQVQFQTAGYWLQTGGLFGRSIRQGNRLRIIGFRQRIAEEVARIAQQRPVI